MDFENEDNPGGSDEDFGDFDPYEILTNWMEDKQGNDNEWSHEDILETLREFEVVDAEGVVNMENMNDALNELNLTYKGFGEETWEDIIAEYDPESGS